MDCLGLGNFKFELWGPLFPTRHPRFPVLDLYFTIAQSVVSRLLFDEMSGYSRSVV